MKPQYIFYLYFIILEILGSICLADKIPYFSTEHAQVTFFNPKYFKYVTATSRRYGRRDPFYYIDVHWHTLQPWSNNVTVSFYFYEWLTNVYKRSFVEIHFKFCDLILKDKLIGPAMRQGWLAEQNCPFKAGEYHLYNKTMPLANIPDNIPFRRARVYINGTLTDTDEVIAAGQVDLEIKLINARRKS